MNCNLKSNFGKPTCKRNVGEGEFRIVVPKNDNSGKPISTKIIKDYGRRMNKIFGGSTIYPSTKGCYSPPGSSEFYCENSLIISSIRDFQSPYTKPSKKDYNSKQRINQLNEDEMKVKALGRKMAKELGQDSILVEYLPVVDASMVKKKKSWKASLPSSKLGDQEIFSGG